MWSLCCEQMCPHDIIIAAASCSDLAQAAQCDTLWSAKLNEAVLSALTGLAKEHDVDVDREMVALTHNRAWMLAKEACPDLDQLSKLNSFFHVIPHVATAAVGVLSIELPRLCLLSFAQRAYDTTDFVDDHPGGSENMQEHHGVDATRIFDAFPHSMRAHDLMRDRMLRFDGVAFVGRFGAPRSASGVLPRAWTASFEVTLLGRALHREASAALAVAQDAAGLRKGGWLTRYPTQVIVLQVAATVLAAVVYSLQLV